MKKQIKLREEINTTNLKEMEIQLQHISTPNDEESSNNFNAKSYFFKMNDNLQTEDNDQAKNNLEKGFKSNFIKENFNNINDRKNLGFFKRATTLLRRAFIPRDDDEEEEDGKNLNARERKKLIINHIRSFQKYCFEEELATGEEISNFYFMQFFEIFLIHFGFFLFGIFIVPVYRFIYGPELIRNLGFWGKRINKSRNAQYFYWIVLIVTLVISYRIYLANMLGDENNIPNDKFFKQYITLSISYMSLILVILRYLIVSIKYGFFPKNYFNDIKKKNIYKSNLRVNYLKFGWIEPDFYIINIYLKSAFKSNNTNYKYFFLECVGQINEDLIAKINQIENEIQKGQNKKRESYKRKIKKEKKSALKTKRQRQTNPKKINKEDIQTNKDALGIAQNQSLNNEILNKNSCVEYEEDRNFKMKYFFNSIDQSNSNGFFQDIIQSVHNKDKTQEIDDKKSNYTSNNSPSSSENNSSIEKSKKSEKTIQLKQNSSLPPALQKLKNFVNTTLKEHIKKMKSLEIKKKESLNGKIEYVNKDIYRINGLYLSKMIMKQIHKINFKIYKIFHIFLVILLLIIPNFFIYKIFDLAREGDSVPFLSNGTSPSNISNSSHIDSNGSIPFTTPIQILPVNHTPIAPQIVSTNITTTEEINYPENPGKEIKLLVFSYVSLILALFSLISGIIPVWLNTENLIYGLIDFERRRKLMEILYDIINPRNKDSNYDLPILNIANQETMLNWYNLRTIMMLYGKRFTERIMIQTSVFSLYLLVLLIFLFMIFIGNYGNISIVVNLIFNK